MAVSWLTILLVMIFGSSSWLGTNSIWMQLPLITASLPEGWSLPSYLAAVVQIACVGPIVYSILHKGCVSINVPTVPLITAFLLLACFCQLSLVFAWRWTLPIGNQEYSVALYILLFGLALVNATSNVLFMPFMAQFHHAYLNAYFVGMGFSSLIPSLIALFQGAGTYICEGSTPYFAPPLFSVSSFFFAIFVWTTTATVSFEVLCRRNEHERALLKTTASIAQESTPLKESKSSTSESNHIDRISGEEDTEVVVKESKEHALKISRGSYVMILIATTLVNAQMNGLIPSVQSYAALPYSQATYHYGIVLASIVSPSMSFLSFFVTIRSTTQTRRWQESRLLGIPWHIKKKALYFQQSAFGRANQSSFCWGETMTM